MKKHMLAAAVTLLLPLGAMAQQSAAQISMPNSNGQPIYQSVTPIQPTGPAPVSIPTTPDASAGLLPPGMVAPVMQPGAAPVMAPAGGGTASEQGYVDNGPTLSEWDIETIRSKESARQRGHKAEVFARSSGVGSSSHDATWLQAWENKLLPLGVHPDKIKFESNRLTKDQFGRWASRQVWAVEEGLIKP